ncbi:MAG: hypothetical protein WCD43_10315 [Candidatus Acidiferrales bacterium]
MHPYNIVLLNQFLKPGTVRLADYIGVGCHVRRIKLVSEPLRKSTEGAALRDWQRAYDPTDLEFTPGSAHRFFIFMLGGNNHEGCVSKAAQQPSNIQNALLRAVGRR